MLCKLRKKIYPTPGYYHVYNCGANNLNIFNSDEDYRAFLDVLEDGITADNTHTCINIVAYSLIPCSFHMLLYVKDADAFTDFMRRVNLRYTRYFNQTYHCKGRLFDGRHKIQRVHDVYLKYITRYIHLTPKQYMTWKWSSLPVYCNQRSVTWLDHWLVHDMDTSAYREFMNDWRGARRAYNFIKSELASPVETPVYGEGAIPR